MLKDFRSNVQVMMNYANNMMNYGKNMANDNVSVSVLLNE